MRFTWRTDQPLTTFDGWFKHIDAKNRKEGTSAPTLAESWAGPLAIAGALAQVDALTDFRIENVAVEAQTRFDDNHRGPRNHDLLVSGEASGGRTVVSVEAKAGEPFDKTLGQYRAAGDAKDGSGRQERLDGLLAAFAPDLAWENAEKLRWQLFAGVAGAVAAAQDLEATQAVFLVHEFLTSEGSKEAHAQTAHDLHAFGNAVFGTDSFPGGDGPWCVGPLPFPGNSRLSAAVDLYVAKVVTDLRPERFAG